MIFNMMSGRMKTPVLNSAYPQNVTVNAGTNASFRVAFSEDGMPSTYTYQWYVNGAAVSGATEASFSLDTASRKGTYSVSCIVTNAAGAVQSRTATLAVRKTPVLNSSYPVNTTVELLSSVTCSVAIATAGYPASYTYQWYKKGSAVSGATGASYAFTPTAIGTTQVYCRVTNAAGSVNSRTAAITTTAKNLFNYNSVVPWSAANLSWSSDFTAKSPTASSNADGSMKVVFNCNDGMQSGSYYTTGFVDLTNFKTLTLQYDATRTREDTNSARFFVRNSTSGYVSNSQALAEVMFRTGETATIDVSGLTGNYIIGICFYWNPYIGVGQWDPLKHGSQTFTLKTAKLS